MSETKDLDYFVDLVFKGKTEEEKKILESKMFNPLLPKEERIKSPYQLYGQYLVRENPEKFQQEFCSDCALGDHAGCKECSYK